MLTRITLPHTNVNFAWATDIHLADRPPGRRQDDYATAILNKITFWRSLTEKVKGVGLCGGDVFHLKQPKANSLGLIIRALSAFGKFPTDCVYGAIGNHDLTNDRMDSLHHQPLGLLIEAGVYHNLVDNPVLFSNEDDTIRVQVDAFPYCHEDKMLDVMWNAGPRHPDATYRVGIVHAFGAEGKAQTFFGHPTIGYDQCQGLDYDFLLWGHDHSRKETVQTHGITHINLGSLARACWEGDEADRVVPVVLLSFTKEGPKYQEKKVPVSPIAAAFVVADKGVENAAKSDAVKSFLTALDEAVGDIETSDPREIFRQICTDPKLLSLVLELCNLL